MTAMQLQFRKYLASDNFTLSQDVEGTPICTSQQRTDLHLLGFLTPATWTAECVHHPVWDEASPDVILVANLCSQGSSIPCTWQ